MREEPSSSPPSEYYRVAILRSSAEWMVVFVYGQKADR